MSMRHCEIAVVRKRSLPETVMGYIKGIIFLPGLYFACIFGSVYYLFIWVPFIFLYQPAQRLFSELFLTMWFELVCVSYPVEPVNNRQFFSVFGFYSTFGCKHVMSGDLKIFPLRSLVIMNHRTRFDFLFYWYLAGVLASLRDIKIVLKSGLKMQPGFGWAMQMCMYVFLRRNWDKDKAYVEQILSYYKLSHIPYHILMFPEGTNLTANTVGNSNKYANSNDLPEYEYTLHPRSTGFLFMLDKLQRKSSDPAESGLDAIIDITIGYKGHFLVDELKLLAGYFPEEIHFHLKQYKLSEIPSSEEGRERWLREVWREKEGRLKRFYEGDHSFGPEARHLPEKSWLRRSLVILFWSSPFLITYLLWSVCPRWALVCYLLIPLFYFLQYKYDGVERFIAARFIKKMKRTN